MVGITYDLSGRKLTEMVRGEDLVTFSLTQYSYDAAGRLECTAVRMIPAAYGELPARACTPQGTSGVDRITRTICDVAGQALQVRKGVGTTLEIADVTFSYTDNGKIAQVIDANSNRAQLRYDGHDRQERWVFPSKTRPGAYNDATPATALASAGVVNEDDYESYTYDANGNRLTHRKRDGSVLGYQYEALNRIIHKSVPDRGDL